MANITHGMNIDEVKTLAKQMDSAATQIQNLARQITTNLHNAGWSGPDRNRFESDWNGQHAKQLAVVISALQQASQIANKNAGDQFTTSSNL